MQPNRLMVMAAGMSSRMKQESAEVLDEFIKNQADTLPKCMMRLGKTSRPFLDYLLYNAKQGGIDEVLLILNPRDNVTKQYYEDQTNVFGLTMHFATQNIPADRAKPLGTSDAILQALEQQPAWTEGRFVVCNADNIYPAQIFELLTTTDGDAMIAFDAADYEESRVRNCAIVQQNEAGFLTDLIEKPTDEQWHVIQTTMPRIGFSWNIFVLRALAIMPYLQNTPLHPLRLEKELPNSVRLFVKQNPMQVIWANERIPDLTSKADIKDVQRFLDKNFDF